MFSPFILTQSPVDNNMFSPFILTQSPVDNNMFSPFILTQSPIDNNMFSPFMNIFYLNMLLHKRYLFFEKFHVIFTSQPPKLDGILNGTTTSNHCEPGANGNEEVLHAP